MNELLRDILKYFILTFLSLELIYAIARSSFNFYVVMALSLGFTILYTISKLKLFEKFIERNSSYRKGMSDKDRAL